MNASEAVATYCSVQLIVFLMGGWRHLLALPGEADEREGAKRMMLLSPVWPYWAYRTLRGDEQ